MAVAIEFDVSIDVVDEVTKVVFIVLGGIERLEKAMEHLKDDVLTTVRMPLRLPPSCWHWLDPLYT